MALVPGKRTVPARPRSSIANDFAAVENQLMTKVLLIEDDSETAEEITAELADRGFEVEWSANGIEGLDKARSSQPDAMIVDRLLPGMDGLTIIEALRKDQVRTPVLVLSALAAVDDRVRGLRMGGDDYLTKPFAIVELVVAAPAGRNARDDAAGRAAGTRSDRAHCQTRRSRDRFAAARVSPA
jgi:two-component system OmpR family response regulator